MKRVIFIMGTGHSGSTLLDLTLGSHSKSFSLGEFSNVKIMLENGKIEGSLCRICGPNCEFWNRKELISTLETYFKWSNSQNWFIRQFYGRFGSIRLDIYKQLFQWTKADNLIDSSKSVSWIRRQLLPFWFWKEAKPYLIYICRDGRAVVNSYLRKYPQKGVAKISTGWAKHTREMERFYEEFFPDKRFCISYEFLASDPERSIMDLCKFLELDYQPDMLQYWKHSHHILDCNFRTRSLILKYREHVSDVLKNSGKDCDSQKNFDLENIPGVGIQLDLRWKQELSADQLKVFEDIAGELNRRYAFESERALE